MPTGTAQSAFLPPFIPLRVPARFAPEKALVGRFGPLPPSTPPNDVRPSPPATEMRSWSRFLLLSFLNVGAKSGGVSLKPASARPRCCSSRSWSCAWSFDQLGPSSSSTSYTVSMYLGKKAIEGQRGPSERD